MEPSIITHYFKFNIGGEGYSLLKKTNGKNNTQIVVISEESESYQEVQNQIEDNLSSNSNFLTLSFLKKSNCNPLVAYGCKINEKDEYGRLGLYFIHCIELNSSIILYNTVLQVVQLLTPLLIKEFTKLIGEVALGSLNHNEFINYFIKKIENNSPVIKPIKREINFSIINHNCSGAAPIAWLTFASVVNGIDSEWSINDVFSENSTITVLTYNNNKNIEYTVEASEILCDKILCRNDETIEASAFNENVKGGQDNNQNFNENSTVILNTESEKKDINWKNDIKEPTPATKENNLSNQHIGNTPPNLQRRTINLKSNVFLNIEAEVFNIIKIIKKIFYNQIIPLARKPIFFLFALITILIITNISIWHKSTIISYSIGIKDSQLTHLNKIIVDQIAHILSQDERLKELNAKLSNIESFNSNKPLYPFYYVAGKDESPKEIAEKNNITIADLIRLNPRDIKPDGSIRKHARLLILK